MQKPLFGYLVAALIGAAVSTVVGYFVYAAPGNAVDFHYWVTHPLRFSAPLWSLAGLLAGSGLRYVTAR